MKKMPSKDILKTYTLTQLREVLVAISNFKSKKHIGGSSKKKGTPLLSDYNNWISSINNEIKLRELTSK